MVNKRKKHPWHIHTGVKFLVLFGLTLAVYAQTFDDPYHFDDSFYITNNASIRNLADWPATFSAIRDFQVSRFVVVLTFAINYYFHQLNVFGYHAVNFLIHLITAGLVWRMGEMLIILQGFKKSAASMQNKRGICDRESYSEPHLAHAPYWAALLFAVHPANTQAVVYLSQRCESLAAMFYLAAVCFYLQARIAKMIRGFIPAVICGLMGMFSKETVITLPLTVIFLEFFFFSDKDRFILKKRWVILICACLIFVVPALLHFNFHQILFSPTHSQSHPGEMFTLPNYILTQLRVFVRFLSLSIVPLGMNLDYDFAISRTLFEPETFLSLLILIGMSTSAVCARKKAPMLTFAVAWFFLVLSANCIPRANVIFEHKMYLVLAGVLPAVFICLFDMFKNQRLLIPVLSFVVLVFALLAVQRNSIWRDDIALWTDVISKSPFKSRPYNHRGMAYKRAGFVDLAIADFNRVIDLAPNDASGYLNRGNLFKLMAMNEEALSDYFVAIQLEPQNHDALAARSSIFRRLGQLDRAMSDLDSAIMLAPDKSEYFSSRAHIRQKQGDIAGAILDCTRAIKIQPDFVYAYNNRGNLYLNIGDAKTAIEDYDRALRIQPLFAEAYLNRSVAKFQLGMLSEAREDMKEAQALGAVPKPEFVRQLNEALENENSPQHP